MDIKIHFIKALESQPHFSEAHFQLAIIYADEKNNRKAEEHFNFAIKYDLEEADLLDQQGNDLIKKYQFQNAKDKFIKSQQKKISLCRSLLSTISLFRKTKK